MMSYDYPWEKLHVAVLTLAQHSGTLQERLADAYISSLIRLEPEDFPEELRESFVLLEQRMTREDAVGDEGTVVATTRLMEDDEARRLIEIVVSLYDQIAKLSG